MSRNYKIRDQDKLYFISFATVNWIDTLTRPLYKDIIVESVIYCIDNKGLEVYAWCIMTNHVHMIIGTIKNKMEYIIRDLKRHTSKEILKVIENNYSESRKDWMLWIACPGQYRDLNRPANETPTTRNINSGNKTINLMSFSLMK